MSNELAIPNEVITALDKAAKDGMLAQTEVSQFKRTLMTATAIGTLRDLLTPKVMEPIMKLQNTSLGFRTDNPNGYPVDVVRDCIIEASFKGVYPVGNEFNIISSRCYITKEGYFHKLSDLPNFWWIEVPGIPRNVGDNGAIVKITLEWKKDGVPGSRDLEFAVRVNKGMGADAIIGKAIRKARAWLFAYITGQEFGDGDVEDGDVIDAKVAEPASSPFEQTPQPARPADELPM